MYRQAETNDKLEHQPKCGSSIPWQDVLWTVIDLSINVNSEAILHNIVNCEGLPKHDLKKKSADILMDLSINPNSLGCVQNHIQIGGFETVRVNVNSEATLCIIVNCESL